MTDIKAQQFLTIVQTIVTANCITLSVDDEDKSRRHIYSATGVIGTMSDALRASTMIPVDMNAAEAADEFCFYMLENLRNEHETVPFWFLQV